MKFKLKFAIMADTIWKTAVLLMIAFVMSAGLMLFWAHRSSLVQQRLYFVQGYFALAKYQVGRVLGGGAGAVASAARPAEAVPVLLYHGIDARSEDENISLSSFADQMIGLKLAGYQTITTQEYLDFMRHGRPLPSKPVLITFDDGRKDSYYPVQSILEALDLKATMFVITKASLVPYSPKFYLNPTELKSMKASGHWDLQPHAAFGHFYYPIDAKGTPGHFYNNKLWRPADHRLETDQEFADRVWGDLWSAKVDMAQQMGSSSIAFAFPFNEFGVASQTYPAAGSVLLAAVKSVYPIAFYQVWPNRGNIQNYPQDPNFLMKRILVDAKVTTDGLLGKLADSSPKHLPFRSDMRGEQKSWLSTWGDYTWDDDGLIIRAAKDGQGAAVFVDGAGAWRDYAAKVRLQLQGGESVRINARYYDDRNYAACTYTTDGVLLEETVAGRTHKLGEYEGQVSLGDMTVGVNVRGRHIQCTTPGAALASDVLTEALPYGGIGFAIWGPIKRSSELLISDVSIDPL